MRAREESISLLALLELRPRNASWSQLANEIMIAGSAQAVLNELCPQDFLIADPQHEAALSKAEQALTDWESRGLDFLPIFSQRYPSRLAAVFDAPPFLFAQGEVIPDDKGMSVVGSRNVSREGEQIAAAAVHVLAARGLTVFSGLAKGVDTVAHTTALTVGARTVAVLGTGITQFYPDENRELQEQIAREGALLSQFYPDAPPMKASFPMRNATMSGLGLATIVVEAGEHSGTRIQARKAADHGRPVILSDLVVRRTEWGRKMADQEWVWVADSPTRLEEAVDRILTSTLDVAELVV